MKRKNEMTVNIKGRNIEIDDALAGQYAGDWGRLPDERDVVIYIDACCHDGRAYEHLDTLSDSELAAVVERGMREEL
jgi:hypothetical protein